MCTFSGEILYLRIGALAPKRSENSDLENSSGTPGPNLSIPTYILHSGLRTLGRRRGYMSTMSLVYGKLVLITVDISKGYQPCEG